MLKILHSYFMMLWEKPFPAQVSLTVFFNIYLSLNIVVQSVNSTLPLSFYPSFPRPVNLSLYPSFLRPVNLSLYPSFPRPVNLPLYPSFPRPMNLSLYPSFLGYIWGQVTFVLFSSLFSLLLFETLTVFFKQLNAAIFGEKQQNRRVKIWRYYILSKPLELLILKPSCRLGRN